MANLEIYLTNLTMYHKHLIGKFVKLPIKKKHFEKVLKEIGINNLNCNEYFITDVKSNIPGMEKVISEYSSISELNEIAEKLEMLSEYEEEKLKAIMESERISTINELLETINNIDEWNLYENVHSEKDLGFMYAEELLTIEIPENIKSYFDYERYGRDIRLSLNGTFTTFGYIVLN